MKTRSAVALWTLALLLAAGAVLLIATSDHENDKAATAALVATLGLAFVGSGLVARSHRPDNPTGLLMILVGFAWFPSALAETNNPVLYTAGVAVGSLALGPFVHLILAFPSGFLQSAAERLVVGVAYGVVTVGQVASMTFDDLQDGTSCPCPRNTLLIRSDEGIASGVLTSFRIVALLAVLSALVLLLRRWRAATRPLRRAIGPVLLGASVALLLVAVLLVVEWNGGRSLKDALWLAIIAALASVPLAFLVGLLRSRLARDGVGRLLVELSETPAPGELRDGLRRALHDPTLRLAYWLPETETWVDEDGSPAELLVRGSARAVTTVESEGRPLAALEHDSSLLDEQELVDAVVAAASIGLKKDRHLQALRQSETRNRALLHAVPDLIFRVSRDGRYLDYKREDSQLLATPDSEVVGRTIHERLPAEVAERVMRCADKALRDGAVHSVEYELVFEGVRRFYEGRIVASGTDEFVLIVRDFTHRKRAENQVAQLQDELRSRLAELKEERDLIGAVIEAAPSLFCLLDAEWRVIYANRATEDTTGFGNEVLRGRLFWEALVVPEQRDDARVTLQDACDGDSSAEHEHCWETAGGARLLVSWSVRQLSEEQREARYLVSGLDFTERDRQREELRRLYRELEARLEELRASRVRLVEAGDSERRRLERNLHDGAQQRLVSLALSLRLAQTRPRSDPDGAESLISGAGEELTFALEELRELARGIHPAVLTDRGLDAALETLAARAPLPVELRSGVDGRLPRPVEAAAYYVVSEALANVVKYARATSVEVNVARLNGTAVVEVADDGIGGADPGRGSGLRGLADRVEALDGRLEIESEPGRGTRVRAEIPVDASL